MPESRHALWIIVPVKDMANAKQRLAGVMSQEERTALFRAMFEDVLDAISAARGFAGAALVTRDPHAIGEARSRGLRVIEEPANRGHTEAVTYGARVLAAEGAAGLLQIPADLPLVTAGDLEAVAGAHGAAPAVTIAPSRDKAGSNAIACSPPDVFPFRFGDDSFYPHLDAARAIGIEPVVIERPGIAIDVDTPDDLRAFVSRASDTRAYAYVSAAGIVDRVAG